MNSTLTPSTSLDFSVITVLIISTHVFNLLLGLPLNVYIIVLLFPGRGVMEASDVFSWNQAFSEIFFVLYGPFQSLCRINQNLCQLEACYFFLGVSLSSRCLFQSCVCVERYLAVVHPVTFLRYKPLRYRVACSIAVWLFSLAIGFTCSCVILHLPYKLFTAVYGIVLVVVLFCCVSILGKLRAPGPRDMERDAGEMNAAKKKAFQVVSFNLLAFLIQNITVSVAFGFQNVLSSHAFSVAVVVSLVCNIVTGHLQSVYALYRAAKLPSVPSTPWSRGRLCSG